MTPGFEYSEIGTWLSDLPDELVASIGQDSDPNARFNFVVRADPVDVNVIGPDADGPLRIETTLSFPADVLSAIRARPERFFAEASAILASAPGFHQLRDEDGSVASVESFSTVALRYDVYPDGANKHTVLSGIVDLLTTARHLRDAGDRLVNAPRRS